MRFKLLLAIIFLILAVSFAYLNINYQIWVLDLWSLILILSGLYFVIFSSTKAVSRVKNPFGIILILLGLASSIIPALKGFTIFLMFFTATFGSLAVIILGIIFLILSLRAPSYNQ